MRLCKLQKLLYYFHRTTGCFNGRFGLFADCIHFESNFTFQFTVTQDFYLVCSSNQAIDVKIFH